MQPLFHPFIQLLVLQMRQSVPDVVPRSHLPDLAINTKNTHETDNLYKPMETSPEHRVTSPKPFLKPRLRPVTYTPSTEKEEQSTPWNRKLNKVADPTPKTINHADSNDRDEVPKAPWTPKLRKVENPAKEKDNLYETPPALPPRPKLKPLRASHDIIDWDYHVDCNEAAVPSRVSSSTKVWKSPTETPPANTQQIEIEESTTTQSGNLSCFRLCVLVHRF